MNKTGCLYSIVRFAPFIETGEFANVGIVMMAPEQRYFGFQLIGKRHARVTNFFEQLDAKVFKSTVQTVRTELERIKALMDVQGFDKNLFIEMIRPREAVVKFSPMRMVLVQKHEQTLKELYGYYVERDFVSSEYVETTMARGLRQLLEDAKVVNRYIEKEIGNNDYQVRFPFVESSQDTPSKAIKPLNLAQPQAKKILDHGGQWLYRINALKKRHLLPPQVLFAVKPPPPENTALTSAFDDIVGELKDAKVQVLLHTQNAEILEFARA
jgi:hypothetical protein